MVFHGLGPLGCIPSQRVKSKRGQCLKRVNEWILQFNSNVQKLINTLNHRLPNVKLAFADTYPLVLDLINNPSTYGNLTSPIYIFLLKYMMVVINFVPIDLHN